MNHLSDDTFSLVPKVYVFVLYVICYLISDPAILFYRLYRVAFVGIVVLYCRVRRDIFLLGPFVATAFN